MVDKIFASVIRTVVPLLVGIAFAALAKVHLNIDNALLTDAITAGVTTAYYAGVRWLEVAVNHKWGWALGKAGAPQYEA